MTQTLDDVTQPLPRQSFAGLQGSNERKSIGENVPQSPIGGPPEPKADGSGD